MTRLRRLVIEVSNRCNLRCRTCTDRPLNGPIIQPEAFEGILKKVSSPDDIELVRFVGAGETLLVPYFDEMVARATKAFQDTEVNFFTNGMLLEHRLVESLLRRNVRAYITLSMDAATPHVFEYIRRGASFDRILKNIENIGKLKEDYGSRYPVLKINFTMLKHNVKEIPKMVKLAS
ncbi:MAG: radical SAM protein, partial [Deltaproteobacteria bacterium]|nr:radical SAM protein [Deltaproteobacteria bacterium]